MLCSRYALCCILIVNALIYPRGLAEEVKKIQDNSFLIEEAYNQEPGVVQHIQTFQYLEKSGIWGYSFTQEWPVLGQKHQLSYTIPVNNQDDPIEEAEIGDVAFNYRYQLMLNETLALAPRFSTLFPTGDDKNGFGSGAFGYQVNIPPQHRAFRYVGYPFQYGINRYSRA